MASRNSRQPTSVKVHSSISIANENAQKILSQYIEGEQEGSEPSTIRNESVVNQLKRVERDLRGLPPAIPSKDKSVREDQEQDQHKGQDEDLEQDNQQNLELESIPNESTAQSSIDKEERKRLKKLRRKEEKKAKLAN